MVSVLIVIAVNNRIEENGILKWHIMNGIQRCVRINTPVNVFERAKFSARVIVFTFFCTQWY